MANGRVEARCDNCGQTDDHPKLHYGLETYHHDCIPARVMDDIESETLYEVVRNPAVPGGHELRVTGRRPLSDDELPEAVHRLREIVKKAKAGAHGEKLLAYIGNIHEGQED